MKMDVKFSEDTTRIAANFGAVSEIKDGFSSEEVEQMVAEAEERGQQAEYDRFWNELQQNGKRTDYFGCFRQWGGEYIRPKYKVSNLTFKAEVMFQASRVKKIESQYFDLSTIANLTNTAYALFNSCAQLEEIEDINIPATNYYGTWNNCTALRKIAIIRCAADKPFNVAFNNCAALESVTFDGVIGQNGLNLQWSPLLTRESLLSLLDCLADKSADTSGTTWLVTIGDTNKAKLTDDELNIAKNKGWTVN